MWAVTVKYVLLLGTQAKEHSTAAGCCPGWRSYPPCCAVDRVHFHGLWWCSTINNCQRPRNAWKISIFTSENSILQTCKMLYKLTQFFDFNFTKFAVHTLVHTLSPPHLSWWHLPLHALFSMDYVLAVVHVYHSLFSDSLTNGHSHCFLFLSLTKNTIYIDKYTV